MLELEKNTFLGVKHQIVFALFSGEARRNNVKNTIEVPLTLVTSLATFTKLDPSNILKPPSFIPLS